MKSLLLIIFLITTTLLQAQQNVGIGTTTPNVNAALEIKSIGKGVLMPRVSAAAKNAMSNVPKGMMVYDTTYSSFYFHDGNKWRLFSQQNTDSLVKDYISNPQVTANMPALATNTSTTAMSGVLYDNGGAAGNYANNSYDTYVVVVDDSTVGYKVIIEQMNLAVNDTLGIFAADDAQHMILITGTTTGTYYFPGSSHLGFVFLSNASINAAGFKITWSRITATSDPSNIPPAFGWYFNPKKLAVRGGISSNNNWAADSLGRLSFAYGSNTYAKGVYATALGDNVSASGAYATAIGRKVTASGVSSFAIGEETTASGSNSIAMGWKALSSASFSNAIGQNTLASGSFATSVGINSSATDQQTSAFGYNVTASGPFSIAIGRNSSAVNSYATAIGQSNTASGIFSIASGSYTTASGDNSTTLGDSTSATGFTSTAMGNKTIASGRFSTATGLETTARSYASFVMGAYNVSSGTQNSWVSTDPLFVIGNGTSTTPSNALMVLKNGNVGIGTDAPVAGLHIKHAGGGGIILENSNDGNQWRIYSASGDNNLTFYNNAGTEIADIDDITGTFNALSDSRYKKDIENMQAVLPLLMQLQPKQYHFKWQKQDQQVQLGFLAQQAYNLFPQLVSYNKEKDLYKMNYAGFSTVAIKAIQEQQERIQNQQLQIEELENENKDIRIRLQKLEALISKNH